jgi:hypothetical protein
MEMLVRCCCYCRRPRARPCMRRVMLRWAKPHTRCSPAGGCGAAAASSLAGLRVGKADGSGGNRKVVARLGRSMDDGWMRSRVGAVEDREDVDRRRGDRVAVGDVQADYSPALFSRLQLARTRDGVCGCDRTGAACLRLFLGRVSL